MSNKTTKDDQQTFDNLKSYNNKLELESRLKLAQTIIDQLCTNINLIISPSQ